MIEDARRRRARLMRPPFTNMIRGANMTATFQSNETLASKRRSQSHWQRWSSRGEDRAEGDGSRLFIWAQHIDVPHSLYEVENVLAGRERDDDGEHSRAGQGRAGQGSASRSDGPKAMASAGL